MKLFTFKRSIILLFVIALGTGAYFLLRDNPAVPSIGKPPVAQIIPNPLPPVIDPERPLVSKDTEYRQSTDPNLQDTYCKNNYGQGSYTYNYIGQTSTSEPTLECES